MAANISKTFNFSSKIVISGFEVHASNILSLDTKSKALRFQKRNRKIKVQTQVRLKTKFNTDLTPTDVLMMNLWLHDCLNT